MDSSILRAPDWRGLNDDQLQDVVDLASMIMEYRLLVIENPDQYKPLIAEAEADLNVLLDRVPGLPRRVNLHQLLIRAQVEIQHRQWVESQWELLLIEHDISLDTDVPPAGAGV